MSTLNNWSNWKALKIIVASVMCVSMPAYFLLNWLYPKREETKNQQYLTKIIQTGPQREGLKTLFFAEELGLSQEKPLLLKNFNVKQAYNKLKKHPVIEEVYLEIMPPDALYIDYTARQPVAMLGDFENLAIDKFGYVFPIKPFFAPKKLPSIYLSTAEFGKQVDLEKPLVDWNKPLEGTSIELAFSILELFLTDQLKGLFEVKTIDVSNAFTKSLGSQEIVVELEESIPLKKDSKSVSVIQKRFLRLNAKTYSKGLGNYLQLRAAMNEEQAEILQTCDISAFCKKEPIVDLRIDKLGFIKNDK